MICVKNNEGAVKHSRSSEKSTVDVYPTDDRVSVLKLERGRKSRVLPESAIRKGINHPEAGASPAAFTINAAPQGPAQPVKDDCTAFGPPAAPAVAAPLRRISNGNEPA